MDANLYEKLDLFYLGEECHPTTGEKTSMPFIFKNNDLTTHATIIGMTGSGKTGLGIGLIEEAAIDGIPALIIDPKGDMTNLLLRFPELSADEFEPWVSEDEAARKNRTRREQAEAVSQLWRKGLSDGGQDISRITNMIKKSDIKIFTPGNSSGSPLQVLKSFSAPGDDILSDPSSLNPLISGTVSSLLALLDIEGDPLQSREHILISSIILNSWQKGQDLTLEDLIGKIVSPDLKKIGVFPLDTFFPQDKRLNLAMKLNNILASPSFSAWLQGEPLNIADFLISKAGKPQVTIFSIAHLSDKERMFFVTLFLNQLITWMRAQKGSSTLRALFYMDEVFGFFPPSANPPSKMPMLLLLKQARAFGLGLVLATQNPVDLDYKGLSNMGTWFIGRLQTEQDQNRILTGLSQGLSELNQSDIRAILSSLTSRHFLCYSAKRGQTTRFHTRWALSYLKGPMTLQEISKFKGDQPGQQIPAETRPMDMNNDFHHQIPILSPEIDQKFRPLPYPVDDPVFNPTLLAQAEVRFISAKYQVQETQSVALQHPLPEGFETPEWENSSPPTAWTQLLSDPPTSSSFANLPASIQEQRSLTSIRKHFEDYLYYQSSLVILTQPDLKIFSRPGETQAEFKLKVMDQLREEKESALEKLKQKMEKDLDRIEKQLQQAENRLELEQSDVKAKTMDTALSFGVAVLGALFGGRSKSRTVTGSVSGIRKASRLMKEKEQVTHAKEKLETLERDREELIKRIDDETTNLSEQFNPDKYPIVEAPIKPRRQDIFNSSVTLLWEPRIDLSTNMNPQGSS